MLDGLLDPMRWQMTFSEMDSFWDGFFVTLQVVVAGLALSLILGTLLGVFSTTRSRVLRAISRVYVEFYQNTPLPVQVFFMYMAGPQLLQVITGADSPVRISSFALGFLGVGLYHAAYVSEVIRTGIEAVPRGQMEAALSQGFSRVQAYRYIILPQTLRSSCLRCAIRHSTWLRTRRCLRSSPVATSCTTPMVLSRPMATCRVISWHARCTLSSASRWRCSSNGSSVALNSVPAPR